jgi:hypothetical protein
MRRTHEPEADLAAATLPGPLYRALRHIFAQRIDGCGLVGGTALAGFHARHRRSDDLDLFARDAPSFHAASLAVKTLASIGAVNLEVTSDTRQYFGSVWELEGHHFTVDVVLDQNLFRVGRFVTMTDGLCVADLPTLLMTKAATLVSRCGEKDLYDLIWLFREFPEMDFGKLIEMGRRIDGGMNGESVLLSVSGAALSEDACDFALDRNVGRRRIFRQVSDFRRKLVRGITSYLRNQPAPELGELVRTLERIDKKGRVRTRAGVRHTL